MKEQTRADAAMTAAIVFLGGSLVFTGVSLLRHSLDGGLAAHPLSVEEAVGALAAGTGLAVSLWWMGAMVIAIVSAVASRSGNRRLAVVTARWSPAFMRRLVLSVIGLNLLAAPLANAAVNQPIDPLWQASTTSSSQPAISPLWQPRSPVVEPGPLANAPTRNSTPGRAGSTAATPGGSHTVVKEGDTLWSIAAAELGPYATDVEVSASWQEWYRANQVVIGPDPNIIKPGQVLVSPESPRN